MLEAISKSWKRRRRQMEDELEGKGKVVGGEGKGIRRIEEKDQKKQRERMKE